MTRKAFQLKVNRPLADRWIAYILYKFEQVWGRDRGGGWTGGSRVSKFEQVGVGCQVTRDWPMALHIVFTCRPPHPHPPLDRQTTMTENITFPHFVVGGNEPSKMYGNMSSK